MNRKTRTGIDRQSIINWLEECLKLPVGESLYLPCDNGYDKRLLLSAFNQELKIMAKMDPINASAILAKESFKDSRHWLILERKNPTSKIGYKKGLASAPPQRVEVKYLAFERKRILDLMLKDGLDLETIEGLLTNLTKPERTYIKRKERKTDG
jgi:hypothetical protein